MTTLPSSFPLVGLGQFNFLIIWLLCRT